MPVGKLDDEEGMMDPERAASFSIQAQIIRLIQAANGQDLCYAEPINGECSKTECAWRNDCFDEAHERLPSLLTQEPVLAKSFHIPDGIIKLLQIDDGQNA